uniref:Uncharacterized protein n=1 Tax=Globodera rostochiensis TaxID=31243 RepID=A0A914H574_GLORO
MLCQVKFRIELPETATLVKYWNLSPVSGTTDHFTLPDHEQISPGQAFAYAGIKVNGVGEPKITILDTVKVLSTKRCPF